MNSTPLHAIPSRRIRHVALSFARHIELDAGDGQTLYTIHAVGRASRLHLPAGWMVVCVPLSGWLQLESAEGRSEEHTSELQSLMRISYAVFCLKKKISIPPPS